MLMPLTEESYYDFKKAILESAETDLQRNKLEEELYLFVLDTLYLGTDSYEFLVKELPIIGKIRSLCYREQDKIVIDAWLTQNKKDIKMKIIFIDENHPRKSGHYDKYIIVIRKKYNTIDGLIKYLKSKDGNFVFIHELTHLVDDVFDKVTIIDDPGEQYDLRDYFKDGNEINANIMAKINYEIRQMNASKEILTDTCIRNIAEKYANELMNKDSYDKLKDDEILKQNYYIGNRKLGNVEKIKRRITQRIINVLIHERNNIRKRKA